MTRTTKWTRVVWHALRSFEVLRLRARRNGFRLTVSLRRNGDVFATVEECKPPIHTVVERAREVWKYDENDRREANVLDLRADIAAERAEAKADELAAAVP